MTARPYLSHPGVQTALVVPVVLLVIHPAVTGGMARPVVGVAGLLLLAAVVTVTMLLGGPEGPPVRWQTTTTALAVTLLPPLLVAGLGAPVPLFSLVFVLVLLVVAFGHPDPGRVALVGYILAVWFVALWWGGVRAVDLLLLHWPSDAAPLAATLEAMTRLADGHRTRHIGVSNFPSQALERAAAIAPIVTDQVEHHPYLAIDPIAEVAEEHDLFVTAYSPLARGRIQDDEVLVDIAAAHDATVAQIVLAWLLQRGVAAIPKSATPARIEENHGALDVALTDDELVRITGLDRGLRLVDPPFAPAWD